jgi:hypothetical protein
MEKDQTMQQMMQQLLARMDANREERKANLEQTKTDRTADQECMKQVMVRRDDNRERDQKDVKRMMKEMDANQAKADGKQVEMLARMQEEINLVRQK